MLESEFSRRLLKDLRKHPALKDAVIFKLNDMSTKGIPDVLISLHGVTTFLELKVAPNDTTKIQMYYLRRLAPRSYVARITRSGAYRLNAVGSNMAMIVYSIPALADEIAKRCAA